MSSLPVEVVRGAFDAVSSSLEWLHARTGIGHLAGNSKDAILMYHAVGEDPDVGYYGNVSPEQLDESLAYVSEYADVVPLSAFDPGGRRQRQVAITFDDGLRSFYTQALPILEAHDIPATVFVNPAFVDDRNRELALLRHGIDPTGRVMLTDEELLALADHPLVSVGNHTLTHRDLSTIDDEAQLHDEVVESKRLLADRYGIDTDLFSYPHGDFDEESRALVEATHDVSVTTTPFLVDRGGTHVLPRIGAHVPLRRFRWDLSPGGDKLNRLRYGLASMRA